MERKPEWLRVRYNQQAVNEVAELMRDLKRRAGGKKAGAAPCCSDLLDARRSAGRRRGAFCEDRPRHPRAVPRYNGRDADE